MLALLDLASCSQLTALPERIGDCAALTTLDLLHCSRLPTHIGVAERLKARGCAVLLGAYGGSDAEEDEDDEDY